MHPALADNKQKEGLHLSSTKITQVNMRFLTNPIFMGHQLVKIQLYYRTKQRCTACWKTPKQTSKTKQPQSLRTASLSVLLFSKINTNKPAIEKLGHVLEQVNSYSTFSLKTNFWETTVTIITHAHVCGSSQSFTITQNKAVWAWT